MPTRRAAATDVAGATSRINVSQLYSAKKVDGKIRPNLDADCQPAMARSVRDIWIPSPSRHKAVVRRSPCFVAIQIAQEETTVAENAVRAAAMPCSRLPPRG